jgi:FtsH-binding integral membrane protein
MTFKNVAVAGSLPVAFEPERERARFIWKTYTHLFLAVVAFTMLEVVLFRSGLADDISKFMVGSGSGKRWLLVLGAFVVVGAYGRSMAYGTESRVAQYMGLGVYVFAEALIFVPLLFVAQKMDGGILQSAATTTILGFLLLTAVVFTTRKNFSFLRGVLRWGFLCALALIVLALLGNLNLGVGFSIAMIALAGAAILHDTSKVLHEFPSDRYVGAALELFASLAMLFWYVLDLYLSHSEE